MATPKKEKATKQTATVEVIGRSDADEKQEALTGTDVVYLSVGLRSPHKFDDVGPTNRGVVILPGIDDHLRGKKGGILSADGTAVFVSIKRSEWEDILAKHGQEQMFKGDANHAPAVFEVGSIDEFKARKDEIETIVTGLAPQEPEKVGLTTASK